MQREEAIELNLPGFCVEDKQMPKNIAMVAVEQGSFEVRDDFISRRMVMAAN